MQGYLDADHDGGSIGGVFDFLNGVRTTSGTVGLKRETKLEIVYFLLQAALLQWEMGTPDHGTRP